MKVNIDNRELRGIAIISKGDTPITLGSDTYLVPSQSSNKRYKVQKANDVWLCECPDYAARGLVCKHIHAITFWLRIREKIGKEGSFDIIREIQDKRCPYCFSGEIVKRGIRHNTNGKKQRFVCKQCSRRFVLDAFKKMKADGKIITLVLDLYFKGISLRKIQDHLKQFYALEVHYSNIYRWIRKFTKVMNAYVKQFKPEISDMWHADEMTLKIAGDQKWVWNVLDRETRFWLAQSITEERETKDARDVFKKAKQVANGKPDFVVTDGLHAYEGAYRKEFWTHTVPRTKHIRLESFEKKPNNNLIERFHGTVRERTKVLRGNKGMEQAYEILEGKRLYYNYIRIHQSLNNHTPAQVAGIELNLERNRWLSLLKEAQKV